jgi:hypothetical protein
MRNIKLQKRTEERKEERKEERNVAIVSWISSVVFLK